MKVLRETATRSLSAVPENIITTLLARLERIAEELREIKKTIKQLAASDSAIEPVVRTAYPHIVLSANTCGGRPRLAGHRITVQTIALLHRDGETVDGLLETYPYLTKAEIHDALSYYYDHQAEIDRQIEDDAQFYEQVYAEHRTHEKTEELKSIRERFNLPPAQWPYPDIDAELGFLKMSC